MIKFEQVTWKNLLATGNSPIKIYLNGGSKGYPTTLIVGDNGSGKSTILDAITFALFGKPYRNINKPQLVNSINNKDCLVELAFSIGNKKYKIIRGIKPSKFEIYVDDVLLNQDAKSKDYQEILEKNILKMNHKSFTQIVILGAASFTPFMQLSAADRRAVIEDLLDIQIFSNMNVLVKDKISFLKSELDRLKIKHESTNEKIELHKKHIEEMKRNNEIIIERKKTELVEHENAIISYESEKSTLQTTITNLMKQIQDQVEIENKTKKLENLEIKIESNKSKLSKEIAFYKDNTNCPTCKQEISEEHKNNILGECTNQIHQIESGLDKLKEQKSALLSRISEIKNTAKEISSAQNSYFTISNNIDHINKYVDKLKHEIEYLANVQSLSVSTKEQSQKLILELEEIIDKRKMNQEEKMYYDVAAQLLKDGGIKTRIIKQYLPIINNIINKYLASMDFFVNFNIDEEFKETIKSRYRDDFSYENFSEGEKSRIDLALLLTWRAVAKLKNSVNTNLLILDETFDSSLDMKGTDNLLQILNVLPKNTNVFIISHKDQLHDKFSRSIKFEKHQNFSRIIL